MDILESALDGKGATNLSYRASLSYVQFQKSLEKLLDRGLLKIDDKTKLYKTTEHGRKLLKYWKKMERILGA